MVETGGTGSDTIFLDDKKLENLIPDGTETGHSAIAKAGKATNFLKDLTDRLKERKTFTPARKGATSGAAKVQEAIKKA